MMVKRFLRKWAAPLLCGLFFFCVLKFVLFIGYVPTSSMEPAISAGSIIFGTRIFSNIEVGDIAVFRREGQVLVKRVAAIEGQVVAAPDAERAVTVPEDSLYMIGDNLEHSVDSRYWAEPFICETDVIAVLFRQ